VLSLPSPKKEGMIYRQAQGTIALLLAGPEKVIETKYYEDGSYALVLDSGKVVEILSKKMVTYDEHGVVLQEYYFKD